MEPKVNTEEEGQCRKIIKRINKMFGNSLILGENKNMRLEPIPIDDKMDFKAIKQITISKFSNVIDQLVSFSSKYGGAYLATSRGWNQETYLRNLKLFEKILICLNRNSNNKPKLTETKKISQKIEVKKKGHSNIKSPLFGLRKNCSFSSKCITISSKFRKVSKLEQKTLRALSSQSRLKKLSLHPVMVMKEEDKAINPVEHKTLSTIIKDNSESYTMEPKMEILIQNKTENEMNNKVQKESIVAEIEQKLEKQFEAVIEQKIKQIEEKMKKESEEKQSAFVKLEKRIQDLEQWKNACLNRKRINEILTIFIKNFKDNLYKYYDIRGIIRLGFKEEFNKKMGFDADDVIDQLYSIRDEASSKIHFEIKTRGNPNEEREDDDDDPLNEYKQDIIEKLNINNLDKLINQCPNFPHKIYLGYNEGKLSEIYSSLITEFRDKKYIRTKK